MSVCKLSKAYEDISSAGISAHEVLVAARKMDHSGGSGRLSGGSNGLQPQGNGNQSQPAMNMARSVNEFRHPGIKFVGAPGSASQGSSQGSQNSTQEVPFAPRPGANLQKSGGTQVPTLPYSSNFPNQQPASSARGNTGARNGSRMPVSTRPLAASAVSSSQIAATNPASTVYRSPTKQIQPQNECKKRSHAVMEVTKMVLPRDFLKDLKEDPSIDVYAKLPSLWAKTGDPEEIYATRTFPGAKSIWDLTRILPKGPPLPVMPPGTPGSVSVAESPLLPTARRVGRRMYTRSSGASVVDEVYADSRYIGARGKRPRLMPQSIATQNDYGPLDRAEFRDYRLLPADFFVAPLECFQLEFEDLEVIDEEDKGERPRRRRRPPPKNEPIVLASPKPKKRKGRQVTKTSVFVGKDHQVHPDCLPPASHAAYKVDPNIYVDPPSASGEIDEQIWDPTKAAAAEQRGEDIQGFLRPAQDTSSHVLLMQALHQANYSVKDAEMKFVLLYRANNEPSVLLSNEEKAQANEMFEDCRKEFGTIAAKINRSVSAVLVQYYYWKSIEKKEGRGGYERMKRRRKNEDDYCSVCGDGGFLILCEHCHKVFHLNCVNPPLKEAPKTDWYCSECIESPTKLRRMPSLSLANANSLAQKELEFPSPQEQGELASGKVDEELIDLTED